MVVTFATPQSEKILRLTAFPTFLQNPPPLFLGSTLPVSYFPNHEKPSKQVYFEQNLL